MTAITVRLTDQDHKLLQLLCLVTKRSQNALMIDLLHAEIERVLPGKRELAADPDALWTALGIAPPQPTELDVRWAAAAIESLQVEVELDGHQDHTSARRAA